MAFYTKHVFVCCNQRAQAQACDNHTTASGLLSYMKQRIKTLGLAGQGKYRINKAGCLGRCDEGPALVVYPEGIWYTFIDEHDIDEIIDEHILKGRIVERLKI